MNILLKIKSFFRRPKKESFNLIFQEYLKIKADLQASDIKVNGEGINFKVSYQGSVVPFWLVCESDIPAGKAELRVQDTLTTIAVGLASGLNLVEISQMMRTSSTSSLDITNKTS